MKGFASAEQGHWINALAPISLAGGKTSDYWSMKNYSHADILVTLGAAVNVSAVTVFESTDAAGAGEHALTFKFYKEIDANGDVLDRQTDAATFNSESATVADTMYLISVDAAELRADHPFMCCKLTSAGAQLGAVVVLLSGARYAGSPTVSALA